MAISANTYTTIANNIDSAHARGASMVSLVTVMETNWTNTEIDSNDVDKIYVLNSIANNKNELNRKHVLPSKEILNFVFALQTEAVRGYEDIDAFLSENNILVGSVFASLSERVNFTIDSSNIET